MENTKKVNEGYMLVALAGVCWGLMGILTKKLDILGFDELSVSALRPTVAVIFYVIYNLVRDTKCFKTDFKGIMFFILYGVVALDGMFLSFTYAVKYTSIGIASVLLFTNPIFVMVMSYFLFGEKFTKKKIIALVLSIVGCILIVKAYDIQAFKVNFIGIVFGVISGFTVALQNVLGKIGANKYSPKTHLIYSFLFAALFLWIFRSPWTILSKINNSTSLFYVISIGIVATVIPNGVFVKALQYVESGKASIICSIEPIVAAILGFVIFREILQIPQLIGMGFILFSVVLIQLDNKK
ncbi:EamA family transporter [Clostridium aestuarii]|uniref:EamA family transporter n=1 Tax=Clostridium aestuarii TaxID=338193 RepID=A0ABT4D210_9CLOT|nr:EamA family transporter [Clostridium aestuarii]MCY6485142.1 EamA family transporter [Clostridium aestuarii]